MCSRCAADWFLPFMAGAQDERSSLQNFNLALFHGRKRVFVALRCDAGAAGAVDRNRKLRQCALDRQHVRNYADIRAKSDKSNAFDLLFLIHGHKSCCQCDRSERLLIDRFHLAQHIQLLPDLPAVFLTVFTYYCACSASFCQVTVLLSQQEQSQLHSSFFRKKYINPYRYKLYFYAVSLIIC